MSYKDKYSITDIEVYLKYKDLSISKEDGEVILLAIPDTRKPDHEHFQITEKGLKDLYEWLIEYYKEA